MHAGLQPQRPDAEPRVPGRVRHQDLQADDGAQRHVHPAGAGFKLCKEGSLAKADGTHIGMPESPFRGF
eukprot:2967659-Prorocentrum_lima.AAC.1